MQPAPTSQPVIDAAVALLTSQYEASGELELYFVRQIAGAQVTIESLERNLSRLTEAAEPDFVAIDRLTRIQARKQRMMAVALKELKALQSLRNAIKNFPVQTEDQPPLADQMPFIGFRPKIVPLPEPATLQRLANPCGAALQVGSRGFERLAG